MNEYFNSVSTLAATFGALAAIFSGICAWLSYNLSRAIRNEMKSDEIIIHSDFVRPGQEMVANPAHRNNVITCYLFNKSKRKAFITDVKVFVDNKEVGIRWSNKIDPYGSPIDCYDKFGIIDSERLFIYRDDGTEIPDCEVRFTHSFSTTPVSAKFEEYKDFVDSMCGSVPPRNDG